MIGAIVAPFRTTKGLNDFSNSEMDEGDSVFKVEVEGSSAGLETLFPDVFGFAKKADIRERDLFCASFSFRSFSSLAAFLSAFSFSYKIVGE